jgi:hypothetical protein
MPNSAIYYFEVYKTSKKVKSKAIPVTGREGP